MTSNILLTHGYKCNYAINDTKNIVKHLNIFEQTFESPALEILKILGQ